MTTFISTSLTKLPITFTILPAACAGVDGPGVTFAQYLRTVRRKVRKYLGLPRGRQFCQESKSTSMGSISGSSQLSSCWWTGCAL